MSQYRATSTKDIKEAYEKNIGFYVPGYGHVGNFKDFYDNELAGEISLNALAEGARTDPKFVEKLDSLRNRTIKDYFASGGSVQPKEEPELVQKQETIAQNTPLATEPKRPTFAERFSKYETIVKADGQNLLNSYRQLDNIVKKQKPNMYGSFKETYAAERRKAIKDGTLDTHTFEYTDLKTGKTNLYHARTVKEQADWLKKRREENA